MIDRSKGPAVSYYDGYISARNDIGICSKPDALDYDDYALGRWYTCTNGKWGHLDFPFSPSSLCEFHPTSGQPAYIIYALGQMSGQVMSYWPRGSNTTYEWLPGAQAQGGLLHLKQIRVIGEDVYVVGIQSQVFRRHGKGWEVFNQGLPQALTAQQARGMNAEQIMAHTMAQAADLQSIDGLPGQGLYAVGAAGVMFHRSGNAWQALPKVTNADLHRVRVIDADIVYAVGDRGVLLKGNARQGFELISTHLKEDLYGLEWFNGKLYLGGTKTGVHVYDGKNVLRAQGLPEFECHTLHSNAGQLLALGSKHVYLTDDAQQWTFLQNPDNVRR